MAEAGTKSSGPAFVVLRLDEDGRWSLVAEVPRRRGLPARAARSAAILAATRGQARRGETFAAVLRSEWRIAQDWSPAE